jgi:hypothetical protein
MTPTERKAGMKAAMSARLAKMNSPEAKSRGSEATEARYQAVTKREGREPITDSEMAEVYGGDGGPEPAFKKTLPNSPLKRK